MRFLNRLQSFEIWLKFCLVIAASILVLNLATNRLRIANNEWAYNGDQKQQIFEFYADGGKQIFDGDYISDYYENAFLPSGFLWIYDIAGFAGDPFFFSKILSLALMLLFVYMVFLISKGCAGVTWGMFSVILIFCTSLFFNRMDGGLPRAFAYPLGALFILGYIRGSALWCACSLILMALFYPPLLVPYIIVFFLWLMFPGLFGTDAGPLPGLSRGPSGLRRFLWLAGLCVLIILIMVPTIYKSRNYGDRISLSDVGVFPEAGNNGRYSDEDRIEGKNVLIELSETIHFTSKMIFDGKGKVKELKHFRGYALFFLLCMSLYGLSGKKTFARREIRFLIALFLASVIGFAGSVLLYPYAFLPQRAITYTFPLVAHFAVLLGLAGIPGKFKPADNGQPQTDDGPNLQRHGLNPWGYFPIVMAVVVLCALVGKPPAILIENNRDLYEYLRHDLSQEALFAGWPDYTTDGIPLFSRKRILVGVETYQAFHKGYVLEMRKRGIALIDAYLSDDPSGLRRLRDEFGVTYLLVKLSHFKGKKVEIPAVFMPLNDYASRLFSNIPRNKSAVWRLMPSLEIKRIGGYSILDLRKL